MQGSRVKKHVQGVTNLLWRMTMALTELFHYHVGESTSRNKFGTWGSEVKKGLKRTLLFNFLQSSKFSCRCRLFFLKVGAASTACIIQIACVCVWRRNSSTLHFTVNAWNFWFGKSSRRYRRSNPTAQKLPECPLANWLCPTWELSSCNGNRVVLLRFKIKKKKGPYGCTWVKTWRRELKKVKLMKVRCSGC